MTETHVPGPPGPPLPPPGPSSGSGPASGTGPLPVRPSRRRGRILAWTLSILGVVLAVVIVAGFVIKVPYVIISPGEATPLDDEIVSISGVQTYPHDGELLFLTVRVTPSDPSAWRALFAWLDPDREVLERETVVGCLSDAESSAINRRLMDQSQSDAKKAALTRLGYDVPVASAELVIDRGCEAVPASGLLFTGDRLLSIDDVPVAESAAVRAAVQTHQPGEDVRVTVERDDTSQTVVVRAGRLSDDGNRCRPVGAGVTATAADAAACLGISAIPFVQYTFPVDITFDTQRVGGPSAGLAFALAVVDDLTPGDLTGGRRVAVTGSIGPDGTVQEVGGVEQKAITARTQGADLMLVPKGEVAAARKGAGDLRVVGVDTLDDALDALRRAGGAPVPPSTVDAARS